MVQFLIDQATSLADSSTSLSEIENSAFVSFKDLDDDFQKGSGEFSDKILRVFEQCIRFQPLRFLRRKTKSRTFVGPFGHRVLLFELVSALAL